MTTQDLEKILTAAYKVYVKKVASAGHRLALMAAHNYVLDKFNAVSANKTAEEIYYIAVEAGVDSSTIESTKSALLSHILRTLNIAAATTSVAA